MAGAEALVWIRGPGFGCRAVRCASARCSVQDFVLRYCQDQDVPVEYFFVKCNGALINTCDTVQHEAVYSLEPRLLGGKGGFGSMLRALGAQIEKTTNREACRDLSGRRLRDVNHEKAMAEWVKQQAEREAEKEQRRLERLQRKLTEPKHCFTSPDYQQQCHEMAERLEDSVLKGENEDSLVFGVEGLETAVGSSSESSDDDREETPSTSERSIHGLKNVSDSAEMAAKFPSSSQRVEVVNSAFGSPEKLQIPEIASTKDSLEDSFAELGETSTKEHVDSKMVLETEEIRERKKAEGKEPIEEGAVGAGLKKDKETKERTDGETAGKVAPGEDREKAPVAKLEENQPGNTIIGKETIDLLAFNSVAELELLGFEKLKCELMARGLKCGGTLQERAARLFSIRGVAKEQIDPALFAKPLKGKKK
ncbi:replication stress response regulator SDE2 [Otolemur garnettii]|uniref:replication stress response regulator SDE2 n=1 Tax=Otolemur garnettii TaxID=30611 RepID=UPI0006440F35|nr:replication stress response regulator SDE2 [Otolemur garnettii]